MNAIKVTSINTSNALRDYIEHLKHEINNLFDKVSANGEVIIINNFPAVTEQLGKISLLIFINIPYEKGSYYCYDRGKYLNSLVLGINFVSDGNITDIENGNYITEDGSFSYIEELEKQGKALVIYPEECFGVNTVTRDKEGMEKLYQLGYNDGKKIEEYLKTIKEFVRILNLSLLNSSNPDLMPLAKGSDFCFSE